MAMRKLPNSIQSVFSASTQINSYKKAIEELIYNSLDAEALSIAIRVNIEENTIQVIDNGCGVSKSNFNLLGQRYTTSRCVDLEVLKSAPNKYGFRGQSLASIIEVSQNVTITSRCENVDETLVKVFHKGKQTELSQTTQRPSKGTTVEIKGFLYNLNIQKRVINPLNELNDIKSFLEQLSLVHSNISLSLRDESKNEIVFKLHKNRDIYQTLSSLFGVEKNDVQELKVEKNQYKVTAYIGKNKDANHHWIYLNGKLVHNSKLHKVVNDNLTKALGLRCNQSKRKVKSKNAYHEEEDVSSRNKIPFYFIFINCPYYDYDVIYGPKESVVEFKNWESVYKLLEKLIKFYIGDVNLKEVAKPIQNNLQSNEKEAETRDQFKKIMERILKSNPKKLGVSQMQNGIRGKLIKRKKKKKPLKLTLTKVVPPETKEGQVAKTDDVGKGGNADLKNYEDVSFILQQKNTHLDCNDIETNKPIEIVEKRKTVAIMDDKKHEKLNKKKNKNDKVTSDKKTEQYKQKTNIITSKMSKKSIKNGKHKIYKTISTKKPQKSKQVVRKSSKKKKKMQDPLISNFQKATASIKQRCDMLATKANELMTYNNKPKRQVFINETVQYSNVIRNNKNISIRKKVGEVIIHDYVPLPPKFNACSFDNRVWDRLKTKTYVSTYDLVHTILKSQQKHNGDTKTPCKTPKPPTERIHHEPVLAEPFSTKIPVFSRETYESHNYIEVRNRLRENNDFDSHTKKPRNKQFITKQSRDNFITAKDRANIRHKSKTGRTKTCGKRPALFSMFNLVDKESNHDTPYAIEFSDSNEKKINEETIVTKGLVLFQNQYKNGTYTIDKDNELTQFLPPSIIGGTYTVTAREKSQRVDCEDVPQIHAGSEENADLYCSHRSINVQQSIRSVFFTQRYVEDITSMENEGQDHEMENVDQNDRVPSVHLREDNIEDPNNTDIEPLNVCETILCSHDNERNSNNHILSWNDSLLNNLFEDSNGRCSDSLFNNEFDIDSLLCDRNVYSNICKESQVMEGINKLKHINDPPNPDLYSKNVIELDRNSKNNYEYFEQHRIPYSKEINEDIVTKLAEQTQNIKIPTINRQNGAKDKRIDNQTNNFTFKNRHRFVPKGMSPIFENCQSRNECDYNPDKDYYEKTLYSNFANDVQMNSEIFEPRVQNVNELTTRNIEKVNIRLIKDNASLTFKGEILKQANVLGQVDDKFIAAKIMGKSHQSQDLSEFLVLFDQHAVHERIRLENNLKDYLQDDKWKSITLDDIPLKLSKDEILYLHNYKYKFTQFGLQWTVLNNSEISIHAIPEAVLGKNARQVEVVIKAVRSLISEEIYAIKSQKGCVTLYPKSIMDLVFSEACRYAIKFGDRLSKRACMELLSSLSECKTPFQCAHGRPVMAVVMEVKSERRKYELKLPEVHKFVQRSKKRIK